MYTKELFEKQDAAAFLRSAYCSDRLSHAYCLVGADSWLKVNVVIDFCRLMFCSGAKANRPCGKCSACVRIAKGFYPDIHWIRPQGSFIKIDSVRQARRSLQLAGFESSRKVLVIENAESLNAESSNALLKTLEEPTKNTIIFVSADRLENLLPTISSRCQKLIFSSLTIEDVESFLCNEKKVPQDEARFLARLSGGSMQEALACLDKNLYRNKNAVINAMTGKRASVDALLKIGTQDKIKPRELMEEYCCVMVSWFSDVLSLQQKNSGFEFLVHSDRRDDLKKISRELSLDEISGRISALAAAKDALRRNANPKMVLAQLRNDLCML